MFNPAVASTPRRAGGRRLVLSVALSLLGTVAAFTPGSQASATVGPTLEGYPGDSLQALVDAALPGDHIQLHAGTYTGQVVITHSGTPLAPITIEPYGDGPVTVTATFPIVSCRASKPSMARTFFAAEGVDYWTIQGLNIVNGIWVSGSNFDAVAVWFKNLAKEAHDWQTRRSLPGRGTNDPATARGIYAALTAKLGVNVDPAEGWRILNNDISGRGVHATVTRDGELARNNIHNIACGIGPGAWINTYSDFWSVHNNRVSFVAASTYRHYMQEGIRFGSASSYNTIRDNFVSDLPGDGRAITTDIDASWNVFQHNSVTRTNFAYNDQSSGWGNNWLYNTANAIRGAAFVFRGADAALTAPDKNSTTYGAVVTCNRVTNTNLAMTAGAIAESTFSRNYFKHVNLSPNLRGYWTSAGNTWNGSTAPPPSYPVQPPAGSC